MWVDPPRAVVAFWHLLRRIREGANIWVRGNTLPSQVNHGVRTTPDVFPWHLVSLTPIVTYGYYESRLLDSSDESTCVDVMATRVKIRSSLLKSQLLTA